MKAKLWKFNISCIYIIEGCHVSAAFLRGKKMAELMTSARKEIFKPKAQSVST
jgi:hypothetical protein